MDYFVFVFLLLAKHPNLIRFNVPRFKDGFFNVFNFLEVITMWILFPFYECLKFCNDTNLQDAWYFVNKLLYNMCIQDKIYFLYRLDRYWHRSHLELYLLMR